MHHASKPIRQPTHSTDVLLPCVRMLACYATQVLWNTLIGVIPLGGKNSQQIQGAIQKQVKTYQKLLETFTTTSRAEQALINHVQVHGVPQVEVAVATRASRLTSHHRIGSCACRSRCVVYCLKTLCHVRA